ncbi:hypothetical protein G7046_g3644 [Stylonectria norvegica]|nr:hypothetical protein G7046_g3644 [Stylonectria norvegica]
MDGSSFSARYDGEYQVLDLALKVLRLSVWISTTESVGNKSSLQQDYAPGILRSTLDSIPSAAQPHLSSGQSSPTSHPFPSAVRLNTRMRGSGILSSPGRTDLSLVPRNLSHAACLASRSNMYTYDT